MSIFDLHIPFPNFDSQLVEDIVELEKLKSRTFGGSSHPAVSFAIKSVFHLLESFASARVEGNRTTIEEVVEASIAGSMDSTESLREIANIEDAMTFLEREFDQTPERAIDEALIKELHRLCVKNLSTPSDGGEGDETPGVYRGRPVVIRGSKHTPPEPQKVHALMSELADFINTRQSARTDLLRIALAHHRFVYIHPFRNGNGRTVRLLTHAMLLRAGFRLGTGRILNPTAVFCQDRAAYMNALSIADNGDDDSLLAWCEFALHGLRTEILKVDRLLDADYLRAQVLIPTIALARQRNVIGNLEEKVLRAVLDEQLADPTLFKKFYPGKSPSLVSQQIARYKARRLLTPYPNDTSRKYIVEFIRGPLLRMLIDVLRASGFLSRDFTSTQTYTQTST